MAYYRKNPIYNLEKNIYFVLDKTKEGTQISFLEDMYFKDSPAILSYNLVNTRVEEMIQMDTIVHNSTERQDIHNNRVTLPQILQAVEIETKKVLKNVKGRVQQIAYQLCQYQKHINLQ